MELPLSSEKKWSFRVERENFLTTKLSWGIVKREDFLTTKLSWGTEGREDLSPYRNDYWVAKNL